MRNRRLVTIASPLVLSLAILALEAGSAWAGGDKRPGNNGNNPSLGYSAPMPAAYPNTGVISQPTCSGCFYTFPILAVYQCPAVLVGQPGSQVVYIEPNLAAGVLGGQPYLYHH